MTGVQLRPSLRMKSPAVGEPAGLAPGPRFVPPREVAPLRRLPAGLRPGASHLLVSGSPGASAPPHARARRTHVSETRALAKGDLPLGGSGPGRERHSHATAAVRSTQYQNVILELPWAATRRHPAVKSSRTRRPAGEAPQSRRQSPGPEPGGIPPSSSKFTAAASLAVASATRAGAPKLAGGSVELRDHRRSPRRPPGCSPRLTSIRTMSRDPGSKGHAIVTAPAARPAASGSVPGRAASASRSSAHALLEPGRPAAR